MMRSVKTLLGPAAAKTTILLSVVFFFMVAAPDAAAQKRFARTYPAGQNVRIQLMNRTGTVTVEGWNRSEVAIAASLESPAANIVPQNLSGTIVINVIRDNQGRGEVGPVNFLIRVPHATMVDIETRLGNLNVSNISGGQVRAHISTDGDITLLNIGAVNVWAESGMGDILFDGEIQGNGNYRFTSISGNITVRIPFNSSYKLVATAPSTRNISLGQCAGGNFSPFGNGRRVVGKCGDGSASMTVINQRGPISFLRR